MNGGDIGDIGCERPLSIQAGPWKGFILNMRNYVCIIDIKMQFNSKNIRKFQHLSENPVIGFLLFVLIKSYNACGSCILLIQNLSRPPNIDPTAKIHPSASISPKNVYIGKNVIIGEKAIIKSGTSIGNQSSIGKSCVIGYDGFQVFRYKDYRIPIIHTGKVIIGEEVWIGDRTCVDRGLFRKNTSIGSSTHVGKNNIIGHNIQIGSHCFLENSIAIGGKSIIGDHTRIGNGVSIANRISIKPGSTIQAESIITRNVK